MEESADLVATQKQKDSHKPNEDTEQVGNSTNAEVDETDQVDTGSWDFIVGYYEQYVIAHEVESVSFERDGQCFLPFTN